MLSPGTRVQFQWAGRIVFGTVFSSANINGQAICHIGLPDGTRVDMPQQMLFVLQSSGIGWYVKQLAIVSVILGAIALVLMAVFR